MFKSDRRQPDNGAPEHASSLRREGVTTGAPTNASRNALTKMERPSRYSVPRAEHTQLLYAGGSDLTLPERALQYSARQTERRNYLTPAEESTHLLALLGVLLHAVGAVQGRVVAADGQVRPLVLVQLNHQAVVAQLQVLQHMGFASNFERRASCPPKICR